MLTKGMQQMLAGMVQEALSGLDLQGMMAQVQREYALHKAQLNRIEANQQEILRHIGKQDDDNGSDYRGNQSLSL